MFDRVLDRRYAAIVHFVRGLVRIPKRGCHFDVGMGVWVVAKGLLQGVVCCDGFCFISLNKMN